MKLTKEDKARLTAWFRAKCRFENRVTKERAKKLDVSITTEDGNLVLRATTEVCNTAQHCGNNEDLIVFTTHSSEATVRIPLEYANQFIAYITYFFGRQS